MPAPFRLAVIMSEYFYLVQLSFPPAWVQRTGLPIGAPLGKLLGYEAADVPVADPGRLDMAA
jgi:hypothetical protein